VAPDPVTGDGHHSNIGQRNNALFGHCMRRARECDSRDELMVEARAFNENCNRPSLEEAEVARVVGSAWEYQTRGLNRFGTHGSWSPLNEVTRLVPNDP